MEEMLKRGLSLGGEQSGHVIFSDYLFTGDGLCTALNVLRTMALTGRDAGGSGVATSTTLSAGAAERARAREASIWRPCRRSPTAIARVEARVAGQGRLLVRYSGTEPLLRVMLEGRGPGRDPRRGRRRSSTSSRSTWDSGSSCRLGLQPARAPMRMIRLSVNVNKVATLRNSRGGARAERARRGRRLPRRRRARHHRASARRPAAHHAGRCARRSRAALRGRAPAVEFNIEGDPRPDLLDLVEEVRPDQCTLVPVVPGEITSQAGWRPGPDDRARCRRSIARLQARGVRVSLFVDPDAGADPLGGVGSAPIASSSTPSRSRARSSAARTPARRVVRRATPRRRALAHVARPRRQCRPRSRSRQPRRSSATLPHLDEVSIGHAIMSRALFVGPRHRRPRVSAAARWRTRR